MKKIRQGNTIVVRWSIKTNGEDVSLEGRDLRLYAQSGFYRLEVKNWVVDGCELSFKIEGKALNQCGRYDLTLVENGCRENQAILDACNAFEVVAKSCMAGGDDSDGLNIESLELTGDLSHATIGEFYDLITANSKAITEEINRATIAENSIAEALAEEKRRALEAERKLQEGVDETKEKVDAFLADADTSEEAIDKLKELQDYIKEDKSGAAKMLESITSNQRAINAEEKRATHAEADLDIQIKGNKSSIEELSKTSVTEEKLQLSIKAITNVYPSGDPMHMAYVAAGAVWNDATKTWSANGRSGLSNSEIRSLYNKDDMDELLFRKLWNSCNAITYENNKVKYDENTGFYRANGVWHIEYGEALEIFARNPYYVIGGWITSSGINYAPITTLAMIGYRYFPFYGYTAFWNGRLIDLRRNVYASDSNGYKDNVVFTGQNHDMVTLGYCYNLRIVRDIIYWETTSTYRFKIEDRCNCLTHLFICNRVNNVGRVFNFSKAPRLSYLSVHFFLDTSIYGCTLQLHPDVYSYIIGTANPEEMGMSPVMPEYSTYYYIPYQQNLKVLPDNAFWREELDVKGINGEYIYPSFAEYLANNPQNFATAEEWRALATLAEEKGITITTQ